MNEIKRYDTPYQADQLYQHPDGRYVLYGDLEAVIAERDNLRAALELLKPSVWQLLERTPGGNYYRVCVSEKIDSYGNVFNVLYPTSEAPRG